MPGANTQHTTPDQIRGRDRYGHKSAAEKMLCGK